MSDFKPNYDGPAKAGLIQKAELNPVGVALAEAGGGSYCMTAGLVYQTGYGAQECEPLEEIQKHAIVIHWGDIVLAAIDGAKASPEIRRDLLAGLASAEAE